MKRNFILLASLLFFLPSLALAQPSFVQLTDVPAFAQISGEDGITGFLNQLYVLCVGVAAVIAVVQITRAGILYTLTDTGVTEKREARDLITTSILGLLLVLSPSIVFGIINPDILSLKINVAPLGPSRSQMTCENVAITPVVDRQPTAGETWSSTDQDAGPGKFYEQCCASESFQPQGTACSVKTTSIGKGQYCGCTSLENKWQLPVGTPTSGGLIVQFRTESAPGGTGPRCVLGPRTDGTDTYFADEASCKAAYDTDGEVYALIKSRALGTYPNPNDRTCEGLMSAVVGDDFVSKSLGIIGINGVKIEKPPICHKTTATSSKMYFLE